MLYEGISEVKHVKEDGMHIAHTYIYLASSPGSLNFFNVTHRERWEPGKIYHVCDVEVEATWSAACARLI